MQWFIDLCSSIFWAHICKRLWSPGIDSEESIPPAYVAWWAGTTNRVVAPACQAGSWFLGSLKGLQIRALIQNLPNMTYRLLTSGFDTLFRDPASLESHFYKKERPQLLLRKKVLHKIPNLITRDGIFKLLRSPEIDYKKSVPPAYVPEKVLNFFKEPRNRFR